jgi:myxalamid-type polyketide synthase MxaB
MAVELRNALARGAGLTLPATLLFDYPTIDALVSYVLGHIEIPTVDADTLDNPVEQATMNEELVGLSDAEAETLLLEELDSLKKKGSR